MTISSTTRVNGPYTSGTALPFTFKVFSAADLDVIRLNTTTGVETVLVLNSDYTVALNGNQNTNPGGTVNLTAAASATSTVTITSDIANLQPTDLTNQGGFYPEVITDALDRATIQIQQMSEDVGRSLKGPISDGSLNMELPTAAQRANSFLAFDANGVPTAVVSGSSGAPTTITRQVFSGTWSQTVFTLASDPGALGNSAQVYIGGVYQQRSTYTIAGTTLTFSQAPVAGTDNIEFVNFLTSSIGSTSADLVTYTPNGTGAVARSAASKFGETVSVKDFGAVGDGTNNDSLAIQAAIDYVASLGGGVVHFPVGTYGIDQPLIVTSGVSLDGANQYSTTLKKLTATAAAVTNTSVIEAIGSGTVGSPVCVLYMCASKTLPEIPYAYGTVSELTIRGNTNDPNTTTTTYGICAAGFNQAALRNVRIEYPRYGIVVTDYNIGCWFEAVRITAVFGGYFHQLATLSGTNGLYVDKFRDWGIWLKAALYCTYENMAAEQGGYRTLFTSTSSDGIPAGLFNDRIGGAVGYVIRACRGSFFSGGSELHNGGSAICIANTAQCVISGFYFLQMTTDYTGTRTNICAYLLDNTDLTFSNNRFVFAATPNSGTRPAWNYVLDGTVFGRFFYENNRYINSESSSAETGEGWVTVSGGGSPAVGSVIFQFTPTCSFATPGDFSLGSPGAENAGTFYRVGNVVHYSITLDYTPTWTTASGIFSIGGLPFQNGSVRATGVVAQLAGNPSTVVANTIGLTALIGQNSSSMVVRQERNNNLGVNLTAAEFTSGTRIYLVITGQYFMAQ